MLLVSSDLSEILSLSDRVFVMYEGRLVYDGPLAELDPKGKGIDDVFAELTGFSESEEQAG